MIMIASSVRTSILTAHADFAAVWLPRYYTQPKAAPAGHMRHERRKKVGLATAEPTLEGEARRRAMPQSMAAVADQSDRIPGSEAPPAPYRQPASPAPASRRSARIAQMDRTDPCSS